MVGVEILEWCGHGRIMRGILRCGRDVRTHYQEG
jgi:hypothetical protein